jgi:hypothetical protein
MNMKNEHPQQAAVPLQLSGLWKLPTRTAYCEEVEGRWGGAVRKGSAERKAGQRYVYYLCGDTVSYTISVSGSGSVLKD